MGLKNKDGVEIKDVWKDGIKSYMGMTFNGFPNCFMIYSPHGEYRVPSCIHMLTVSPSSNSFIKWADDY